ncbi:hypothetical protein PLUTE_a3534 [Pseudoalteromonas luteoviolacea DSM 6061]|nr:hypothetical protein [Pseudoalteromonas luteoviolacea DSM 6061]
MTAKVANSGSNIRKSSSRWQAFLLQIITPQVNFTGVERS